MYTNMHIKVALTESDNYELIIISKPLMFVFPYK